MTITLNRIAAFRRSTAGATAVEFALAAPILFLLMFAIIEFGRAWWAKNSLQYAVEQAVRYAVVCNPNNPATCPSDSAVKTFATSKVYDQSANTGVFTVSHPKLPSGQDQTCVAYNYQFTPWFVGDYAVLAGAMNFKGSSCRVAH
jgi:Flp pilus assembly protein TadG